MGEVFERCADAKGLHKNQLRLEHSRLQERTLYRYFGRGFPDNNLQSWRVTKDLLELMLIGYGNATDKTEGREEAANNIVRFFFPTELSGQQDVPPPFFRMERTGSEYFRAWPHDEGESRFYAVSLAKKYCKNGRLRWFMASGGDVFRELADGESFSPWAERLNAAIRLGLEFTVLVPRLEPERETPSHGFVKRLTQYRDSIASNPLAAFREQHPDLVRTGLGDGVRGAFRTYQVPMDHVPVNVSPEQLRAAFSIDSPGNTDEAPVYAPTFLNPWLRFHWIDARNSSTEKWKPLFAAIAFNDGWSKNHLHLLTPQSMNEYLKWLTAFCELA